MWGLRILTGTLAGQVRNLKTGKNRVGRADSCDVQLNAAGISKNHAEITVLADKVLVADLNSSNGTYINGVRSQGSLLKIGDKISFAQVVCDLVVVEQRLVSHQYSSDPLGYLPAGPGVSQAGAMSAPQAANPEPSPEVKKNPLEKLKMYIDSVALPGVYRLGETFEFKIVLLGILSAFVIVVTLLSVVPMKQITSESIASESRRRALTIARAMAQSNEKVLRGGDLASFSTDLVLREDGIEDVYVVSRDGNIMAPPERVGTSPKEISFLRQLRGQTKETAQMVSGKVAAAVPILAYDPEIQQNVARAYAVVIYNPGGLAFDDGRAFGLFIQMLGIALLIGFLVFFFVWKFAEYPLLKLNSELNIALGENRDSVAIPFHMPVLQDLITTMNSLLARAQSAGSSQAAAPQLSRENEMMNLAALFGFPTLIIGAQGRIIKANHPFESLLSLNQGQLDSQNLRAIADQALQKNIESLIENSNTSPDVIAYDRLEMSGHQFRLSCQALRTAFGEIEYYVVTISPDSPDSSGSGHAA